MAALRRSTEYTGRVTPSAGGGSSAPPLIFGTYYQGNISPSSGSGTMGDPFIYPSSKPFLFAQQENDALPVLTDTWTNYDLPLTFEHGDNIPLEMPDALGYLRLNQGSAPFGSSSYNADGTIYGGTTIKTTAPVMVQAQIKNHDEIWLWFDQSGLTYLVNTPSSQFALDTSTSVPTATNLMPVTYESTDANVIKFTLNRTVAATETITISLGSLSICENASSVNNSNTPTTNVVIFSQARNCYVTVINRWMYVGARQGDLLQCFYSGLTLPDTTEPTPITEQILDTLPLNSQMYLPHRHLSDNYGQSGGGYAFSSFLPTTFAGLNQLGITDLIRNNPTD